MKKSKELRDVPKKNYIILMLVLVFTIILLIYFYKWFLVYSDGKINRPILNKYMDVINYNELDNYLVENPDSIIYVSVLENVDIRNFEKDFRNAFKNDLVRKKVLYMDLTDEIKDKDLSIDIKNKYNKNGNDILDVPCIMVFEDKELIDIYSIKDEHVSLVVRYINHISFEVEE